MKCIYQRWPGRRGRTVDHCYFIKSGGVFVSVFLKCRNLWCRNPVRFDFALERIEDQPAAPTLISVIKFLGITIDMNLRTTNRPDFR